MENTKLKQMRLTIVAIVLLLLSFIGNVVFWNRQSTLQSDKENSMLKTDSILSVKLLSDKKFDSTNEQLELSKKSNKQQQDEISNLTTELNDRKVLIEKLKRENAGVTALRAKIKAAQKLNKDCEKLINDYIKEIREMEVTLNSLKMANEKLAGENGDLKKKMEQAKNLRAFDIVVLAYNAKRSNKPTDRARKVNRISVRFEIASNPFAETGKRDLQLVIYDSKGNVLGSNTNKFYNKTYQRDQTYSASKTIDYNGQDSNIILVYEQATKMSKGKYKVELYSDGILSGKKDYNLK